MSATTPESNPMNCPKCGEPRDAPEDISKEHTTFENPKQGMKCRMCGYEFEGGLFKNY